MKRWSIIAIILLTLIAIALSVFLLILSKPVLSPTKLEPCNTIRKEGDIDIVFFSSEEEAEKYIQTLLNKKPFKNHKNKFSIHYIDTYKPECRLYKEKALLCNSRETIKKVSSCPNDYIVVIRDKPKRIRSSSYMDILSLNSKLSVNVLPHEFGHSFATLADEYVPATLPAGGENCKKDCDQFNNCYKGCSKSNYFRSIDNGIMRSLSSDKYGEYNSKLIEKKIENPRFFSGLTGMAASQDCSDKQYYLITGRYDGNITIINKSKETGCVGSQGKGIFKYKLITKQGGYEENFNPSIIFTDTIEKGKTKGGSQAYSGLFHLKIPIVKEAGELEINKKNKILAKINLQINNRPCKL